VGAGTYTVTAVYSDANNYGVKSATFTIKPVKLTFTKATITKEYDGTTPVDPEDVSKVSFSGIKKGDTLTSDDYTLEAAFQKADVGKQKVSVKITLKDTETARNYFLASDTKTISATITQKVVTVEVGEIEAQKYTGKAVTPTVTVTVVGDGLLPGDTLTLNKDYTVKYKNNTNVTSAAKKATVTVTAKKGGNYTFKPAATKSFEITANVLGEGDFIANVNPVTITSGTTPADKLLKGTVTLSDGKTKIKGSWKWADAGEVAKLSAGTSQEVSVIFVPSSKNFVMGESVTIPVKVTVK
jgi:hypothetical protein